MSFERNTVTHFSPMFKISKGKTKPETATEMLPVQTPCPQVPHSWFPPAGRGSLLSEAKLELGKGRCLSRRDRPCGEQPEKSGLKGQLPPAAQVGALAVLLPFGPTRALSLFLLALG